MYTTEAMKKITVIVMAVLIIMTGVYEISNAEETFAAKKVPLKKIRLSKSSTTIQEGKSAKLTVKYMPKNTTVKKKVKWTSSKKSVATVKNGKVTARKQGKATITAKVGGKKAACRITVTEKPKKPETAEDALYYASIALFKETCKNTKKDKNVLISPDSLMTAMSIVESGAAGKTLEEMENLTGGISSDAINNSLAAIHNRLVNDTECIYKNANSIWAKDGKVVLKDDFIQKNRELHNASLFMRPFDDNTVNEINNWVKDVTNGKIKKIINGLNNTDCMLIINGVAFDGKWEKPFVDSSIYKGDFTDVNGEKQEVSMMTSKESCIYIKLNGGIGFGKQYKGGNFAFVGILPPEGMSIDKYIAGLNWNMFKAAWDNRGHKEVKIALPEFEYEYETDMEKVLTSLGVKTAFGSSADFSNMIIPTASVPSVYIDKMIHKTHIKVDKDGTQAEAVTEPVYGATSATPRIYLDRPFVYAIIETDTGIPLFIGAVKKLE